MDRETTMNDIIMYVFYYIVCIFTGGLFGGFLGDLPFTLPLLFYDLLGIISNLFNDWLGLVFGLLCVAFLMSFLAFAAVYLCMRILNSFLILKIRYNVLLFATGYLAFAASVAALLLIPSANNAWD